jgi:hypothetical protein
MLLRHVGGRLGGGGGKGDTGNESCNGGRPGVCLARDGGGEDGLEDKRDGTGSGRDGGGGNKQKVNASAHTSIAQRVALSSSGTFLRSFWTSRGSSSAGGWVPTATRRS